MTYTGKVQNGVVVLDQGADLAEGTIVRVEVASGASVRKGSPAAILQLAGTLTDSEADSILAAAQQCRRIDPTLWNGGR